MSYSEWEEKRRHKRYPSDLRARFRLVDEAGETFEEGPILNISRGGLFVHTKLDYTLGAAVEVHVTVTTPFGEERELVVEGKIMWLCGQEDEEGIGINFTKIDRHTQYALMACSYRGEG